MEATIQGLRFREIIGRLPLTMETHVAKNMENYMETGLRGAFLG